MVSDLKLNYSCSTTKIFLPQRKESVTSKNCQISSNSELKLHLIYFVFLPIFYCLTNIRGQFFLFKSFDLYFFFQTIN